MMRQANRHSDLEHVLDGAAVHAQGSLCDASACKASLFTAWKTCESKLITYRALLYIVFLLCDVLTFSC